MEQQLEEKQRQLQDAESYIIEIQEQYRLLQESTVNTVDNHSLVIYNQTIEELTIQIKEYIVQISELNIIIEESSTKYKLLEEAYASLKE